MRTKIIAIMGKAGSGKDTIATRLTNQFPDKFHNIVSCTTRPIREGEQEGVNYYYLSKEEFIKRKQNGDMLETAEFNGWYYGTSKACLSSNSINVGVFNPTGVRSLLSNDDIEVIIFYVRAGDKTRLLRQLNREKNPDVKEIVRRFSTDELDFEELGFIPNCQIINETEEDIQHAINILLTCIKERETLDSFN